MSIAIKIENLSKQYRLGLVSTRTLSHDLNRWWQTSILGKEDPYLKIGETNIRESKGTSEYVWALKDINLDVEEGEVLGIIGKNGAGKSTLLKILSKVTTPTTGIVKARGRIASLLEVGTGFHQEMTGRENIFMNGAIMGMTKKEITRKLDVIVDFAGVERYIDTPVKRYSSGMTIRLGFSVAAHLEPEILIVDEVLAVGDVEFQKKAVGKMQDVSSKDGRTVLFVSHNIASVKSLCSKGLVLKDGEVLFLGDVNKAIIGYLDMGNVSKMDLVVDVFNNQRKAGYQNAIRKVWIENKECRLSKYFGMGEKIRFCFEFELNRHYDQVNLGFGIEDGYGNRVFTLTSEMTMGGLMNNVKSGVAVLDIPENILMPGRYFLTVAIASRSANLDFLAQACDFFIEMADIFGTGKLPLNWQGIVFSRGEISLVK